MKIGLQVVRFNWSGSPANIGTTLKDIAQAAEGAGFDSLWVMDHYYQLPGLGRIEDPMLEGYSALNFMAAVTERVKLGTMVSGVIYREPAFLIKAATTLDVLSGGRAYFGVGAAWFEGSDRAGRRNPSIRIASSARWGTPRTCRIPDRNGPRTEPFLP